jgi:nucleoid-associated protein YgaU
MADKEKKGIFGKVTDAFSSKDEKEEIAKLQEELEEAQKEAAASKEAIKSLLDQNRDKSKVSAEAEAAEKRIKELEAKLKEAEREKMIDARRKIKEERMADLEKAKESKVMTTHKVIAGETLSHLALKYYKHATPPYWQLILEQNKEALQGNERNVREGMELEIPELPEDLKD